MLLTLNGKLLTYNNKLLSTTGGATAPSYTLTTDVEYLNFENGTPCTTDEFNIITDAGNEWFITDDKSWIICTPNSGSGNALITVGVGVTLGLGTITITSEAPTAYVEISNGGLCP